MGYIVKSLVIDFPYVPKKYLADFLRGNFDGDGSIYYDKANKKYFSTFVRGSERFIIKMKHHFDDLNISGKIVICKQLNGNPSYHLRFNAYNTLKLGEFMYKKNNSSLKMIRKYEKFKLAGAKV